MAARHAQTHQGAATAVILAEPDGFARWAHDHAPRTSTWVSHTRMAIAPSIVQRGLAVPTT
ncbi:hypothetical protein G9272_05735 [Streptomyces asoensis]|uniref:Uncharacterized protein n=1 Tax=Streptomyces asoensis TaxID=249586 RepID=A0A6M4WIV8_9ACTN|nr:hypothetical protein [Streptomyces asoensis]QJS99850.1 hypothetical protein G9272_05735 [Streptomyces asoensis]